MRDAGAARGRPVDLAGDAMKTIDPAHVACRRRRRGGLGRVLVRRRLDRAASVEPPVRERVPVRARTRARRVRRRGLGRGPARGGARSTTAAPIRAGDASGDARRFTAYEGVARTLHVRRRRRADRHGRPGCSWPPARGGSRFRPDVSRTLNRELPAVRSPSGGTVAAALPVGPPGPIVRRGAPQSRPSGRRTGCASSDSGRSSCSWPRCRSSRRPAAATSRPTRRRRRRHDRRRRVCRRRHERGRSARADLQPTA